LILDGTQTFNDFFIRKLRPGARPVDSLADPSIITSAADCRLTVFNDVTTATKFWVKSREFTLPRLFHNDELASLPAFKDGAALAIFRLAPADFHRFVSPVAATLGPTTKLPGSLYTVNPQAVNEDFAVFTRNRRVRADAVSSDDADLSV
jgi:phosphatidylserine decarboxylase